MRTRTTIFLLAVLLTCACSSSAQASGRIETRTRLVSQFSALQNQWLTAIKNKDTAALDRLLSEEFEVWTPDQDGPLPREEFQSQAFADNLQSFRIADMAVKSPRDGVAIESFRLQTTTSKKGRDIVQRFFVVNLWVSEKESWRCTDSYISRVMAAPPVPPTRPTGKN
jgi:ketosteroid isomerase-like protein